MQQELKMEPDYFTLQPYPKQITDLFTFDGFVEQFYRYTSQYGTYEEAYEATEQLVVKYFRTRKYASYNSFRNVLRTNKRN